MWYFPLLKKVAMERDLPVLVAPHWCSGGNEDIQVGPDLTKKLFQALWLDIHIIDKISSIRLNPSFCKEKCKPAVHKKSCFIQHPGKKRKKI